MHISNDRYFRDRQRHDLALRMIRHEARTCTIKACTGLTDDRVRRLCLAAGYITGTPLRRRRGKSPRQVAFFTRNAQLQFESACLTSIFTAFGLLRTAPDPAMARQTDGDAPLAYGELFCDAYETHCQLSRGASITFEHAWFLLQQLNDGHALEVSRCRHCHGQFLSDPQRVGTRACPTCRMKKTPGRRRRARRTVRLVLPQQESLRIWSEAEPAPH